MINFINLAYSSIKYTFYYWLIFYVNKLFLHLLLHYNNKLLTAHHIPVSVRLYINA